MSVFFNNQLNWPCSYCAKVPDVIYHHTLSQRFSKVFQPREWRTCCMCRQLHAHTVSTYLYNALRHRDTTRFALKLSSLTPYHGPWQITRTSGLRQKCIITSSILLSKLGTFVIEVSFFDTLTQTDSFKTVSVLVLLRDNNIVPEVRLSQWWMTDRLKQMLMVRLISNVGA